MYSLYIPKYKGDKTDFLITKVIKGYMCDTNYEYSLLVSPGYYSKTETSIEEFSIKFSSNLSPLSSIDNNFQVGLFNGYNGNSKADSYKSSSKYTNWPIKKIEEEYLKSNGVIITDLKCKKLKDHRKMIFFYHWLPNTNILKTLEHKNMDAFLSSIHVEAVLIGSSNGSLNTYYKSPTDKGEADLFMFLDKSFMQTLINDNNNNFDGCVLSNSLFVRRQYNGIDNAGLQGNKDEHANDHEYLKDILRDFLKHSLQ